MSLSLQVDISTSKNAVVAGGRVLYTLTVGNTSQLPVNAAQVQVRIPFGMSFHAGIDAVSDPFGCNLLAPGIRCNVSEEALFDLQTIPAGESRTITFNAQTDAELLNGKLITIPVRVSYTGQPDMIDLRKTIRVYQTNAVDLGLSASTDPVLADEQFTFHIDYGNVSGNDVSDMLLIARLPAGITIDDAAGGTVSENIIEWNIATLASGTAQRKSILVTASGVLAGETIPLRATVSYAAGLVEIDQQAEYAVSVAQNDSPLDVTVAATPAPVAPGGTLEYTITVTNNAQLPVDGITLMFRVPAQISFSGNQVDLGCNLLIPGNRCNFSEEAQVIIGTLGTQAGIDNQATVVISSLSNEASPRGRLILAPIRIEATGLADVINLQHVTPMQ